MYIIHNIDLIVGISFAKNIVHTFSFETKEKKLLIQKQTNVKVGPVNLKMRNNLFGYLFIILAC
jgi:hypothetical protein